MQISEPSEAFIEEPSFDDRKLEDQTIDLNEEAKLGENSKNE